MNYSDILTYAADTGLFTWSVGRPGASKGAVAGHLHSTGYIVIHLNRRHVRAHRLAWFMTYGAWPDGEVDHINGDRSDNRLANLRVVDRAGNSQNRRAAQSNNSHGFQGATWNKQHRRWQAKITANKVRHHLGYFTSPDDAHAAYVAAKKRLHIGGGH